MSKQSRFRRKKPATNRLGKAGYVTHALLRMLGLDEFNDDTSSSSRRIQNHEEAQVSLVPIRIPVGRRRYR